MLELDGRVRLSAFNWLEEQVRIHGDVLPRSLLAEGFVFENKRVPLVGPQGIFKPKLLPQIPLSITTTPEGPYDDSFDPDNLLLYRYRGTDPQHRDNAFDPPSAPGQWEPKALCQRAAREQGERRVERQNVVWQLCRHQL